MYDERAILREISVLPSKLLLDVLLVLVVKRHSSKSDIFQQDTALIEDYNRNDNLIILDTIPRIIFHQLGLKESLTQFHTNWRIFKRKSVKNDKINHILQYKT